MSSPFIPCAMSEQLFIPSCNERAVPLSDVRGPSGLLEYVGKGEFAIKPEKKMEPKKVRLESLK